MRQRFERSVNRFCARCFFASQPLTQTLSGRRDIHPRDYRPKRSKRSFVVAGCPKPEATLYIGCMLNRCFFFSFLLFVRLGIQVRLLLNHRLLFFCLQLQLDGMIRGRAPLYDIFFFFGCKIYPIDSDMAYERRALLSSAEIRSRSHRCSLAVYARDVDSAPVEFRTL